MIPELVNIWKDYSEERKPMAELKKNKKLEENGEVRQQLNHIQNQLEKILIKQQELENRLSEIEKDIYMDNDYDLEIVCPYCNYSFALDADETHHEVECPECHNKIEIDWEGESLEESDCSCCSHPCQGNFETPKEKDDKQQEENDNDDDM